MVKSIGAFRIDTALHSSAHPSPASHRIMFLMLKQIKNQHNQHPDMIKAGLLQPAFEFSSRVMTYCVEVVVPVPPSSRTEPRTIAPTTAPTTAVPTVRPPARVVVVTVVVVEVVVAAVVSVCATAAVDSMPSTAADAMHFANFICIFLNTNRILSCPSPIHIKQRWKRQSLTEPIIGTDTPVGASVSHVCYIWGEMPRIYPNSEPLFPPARTLER